jgi:hypothetical protein
VRGVPGGRLLPSLAGLGLAGSLLYRVWQRGPFYPGWDVLGSAHGLHALSTPPLAESLARLLRGVTGFRYWNSTNSLLYTLGPGSLGRLWPSEYWAHWLTFALVLVTFWLILRVADLPFRDGWFLALAWGASSALVSFSVAGYPYASDASTVRAALKHVFAGGAEAAVEGYWLDKDYAATVALDEMGEPRPDGALRADTVWRAAAWATVPVLGGRTGAVSVALKLGWQYTHHRSNDAFYRYDAHAVRLGLSAAY